jgi:hypothetical protein
LLFLSSSSEKVASVPGFVSYVSFFIYLFFIIIVHDDDDIPSNNNNNSLGNSSSTFSSNVFEGKEQSSLN